MAKCDLCGGSVDPYKMSQLLPSYQSPGIVDVCPSCSKWASDRKFELMQQASRRLRDEIADRAANPPPSWFSRLKHRLYTAITS